MAVVWFHAQEGTGNSPLTTATHPDDADWLDEHAVNRRAYEIWVARGRPEGQALQIRREAEDQLLAERAPHPATPHGGVDQALWSEAQRGLKAE
jgi:hypothetical protein